MEMEIKDMLGELNHQKDQNDVMLDKVAQLEVSLKQSKVILISLR